MKVTIINHTPEPEKTAAAAARLCYSNISASQILEDLSPEKASSFIEKLVEMGHLSPVEHVSFTFAIDGVSRTLLAQITRHRIASFSVQSLRYNNPFEKEAPANPSPSQETTYYRAGYAPSDEIHGAKIPDEFMPAYLRGVYDAEGQLSKGGKLCIALPQGTKLPQAPPFNITPEDGKLLIQGEDALKFADYTYADLDFMGTDYSKPKLVALCHASQEFFAQFIKIAEAYIDSRYYSTLPKEVTKKPEAVLLFIEGLESCKRHYLELVALGVDKEDARNILPMSTQTRIVMTMNVRSLYNFFHLRCCERAQSEIRQLAHLMLEEVKKIAPGLFKTAGAPCEATGLCPEGSMSCGRYPTA